jgi:hypothetical protein
MTRTNPGRVLMMDRSRDAGTMIDNLAIAITHGLMLLACWLLLRRPDLDAEPRPAVIKRKAGPRA